MKWTLGEPVRGDMIRVKSGDIYHVGIYVDDGEVIQFGLAPSMRRLIPDSEVRVLSSDIDTFLSGGFLEVAVLDRKERKKRRSPDETVEFARSKIGEGGYNILYNNCEHFATLAVLGERSCAQADDVRALFKSLPLLDVYVAEIPSCEIDLSLITSDERRDYIEAASDLELRRQRYFVWRLLEYAVERTFGKRLRDLAVCREPDGAWRVSDMEISLSHTSGVVAVALSRSAVGVDIEREVGERVEKFAERILTDREKNEYFVLEDSKRRAYLTRKWSEKESLFKMKRGDAFSPSGTDTASGVWSKSIDLMGDGAVISVASEHLDRIRLYTGVVLK